MLANTIFINNLQNVTQDIIKTIKYLQGAISLQLTTDNIIDNRSVVQ